jgi:hypothetical protein
LSARPHGGHFAPDQSRHLFIRHFAQQLFLLLAPRLCGQKILCAFDFTQASLQPDRFQRAPKESGHFGVGLFADEAHLFFGPLSVPYDEGRYAEHLTLGSNRSQRPAKAFGDGVIAFFAKHPFLLGGPLAGCVNPRQYAEFASALSDLSGAAATLVGKLMVGAARVSK